MATRRSRRLSLPGTGELYPIAAVETGASEAPMEPSVRSMPGPDPGHDGLGPVHHLRPAPAPAPAAVGARPSGRVRHSAKITVYLSPDELFDVEHARLMLRAYGISVDRGRIVRAALALALADFDERGERSELADRLRPEPGGPRR